MHLIHLIFSLALLWLHLSATSLLLARTWSLPLPVARALGIVLPALLLFFLEHFVGLGSLHWVWPCTSLLCALYLYGQRASFSEPGWRAAELAFVAAFGWGLWWKCLAPAIYPTSERVTDLYFMSNYLAGTTLPPQDHWFPDYPFDFYYAFQHYGAALLARCFNWDAGFAYNLAFALVLGVALALAWYVICRFLPSSKLSRALLLGALALGGTGVSPFVNLLVEAPSDGSPQWRVNDQMWASARFIGNYDSRVNTDLGRAVAPSAGLEARELPLENFGYQFYLGDYHPPLASFMLLFLVLALILHLQEQPKARLPQALLALSLPLMLISNTWIFPLLALLLGAWLIWRYQQKIAPDWGALVAGGVLGGVLIYPFLQYFSQQAVQTPIHFNLRHDLTPWRELLLLMWPLLILAPLGFVQGRKQPLAWLLCGAFFLMLLAGEFLVVDDPSVGRFERTNTTMKWWGWAWSGALLCSAGMVLAHGKLWQQRVAQLVLLALCSYALPTLDYWVESFKGNRQHFARLQGHQWFTDEAAVGDTVQYLRHAPRGRVLENWQGEAYTKQTLYALFSGQVSVMGWPHHINLWRHGQAQIQTRRQEIIEFFQGRMNQPLPWLQQHQVRYIVWSQTDNTSGQWATINQALSGRYAWRSFIMDANNRVGVWELRESPLP